MQSEELKPPSSNSLQYSPEKIAVVREGVNREPEFPNRIGQAVLVEDTWKVTSDTACHDLALGSVRCSP